MPPEDVIPPNALPADGGQRSIVCRFCGFENPVGGDACENCGAEFSEGMPESPAAFEGRLLGARLGDIATGRLLWLDGPTDALAAVERMRSEDVDCVLVGSAGQLAGIFTDRDAMLKLAGRRGPAVTLEALMTAHPDVLRAGDTVATAIHAMAVGKVRHVPLRHDDGSITVVAARDIFRHLAARLG